MNNSLIIDLKRIAPYIRYVNNYAPSWSYVEPERIIYDFELMYIADGCVTIWYDGICYNLKKSDILYLKPGIKNNMIVNKNDGFRTHCIHFDWFPPISENDFNADEAYMQPVLSAERIQNLKNRPAYEPQGLDLPVCIKNTTVEIGELFSNCYYSFVQNTPFSQLRLKALFTQLICELNLFCNDKDNEFNYIHPKIQKALDYIQLHFSEPLTVEWIAEKFDLSKKYFGLIFKNNIGKNMNDFLLETRIRAAKDLLIGTDLTIEEIADKTGFGSVHYFSRCFSKAEKMPPGRYRQLNLAE